MILIGVISWLGGPYTSSTLVQPSWYICLAFSTLVSPFIIRLAPRAGKMNQILRCDWLPKWARWSYLARSGYGLCPARKIYHVLVFYPV